MDIFKRIFEAQKDGKGTWFDDGKYLVAIECVRDKNGHKGHSFILECRVVSATKTAANEPSPANSLRSFVRKLDESDRTKQRLNEADIKNALFAILEIQPGQVTSEQFSQYCGELMSPDGQRAQPMKGKLVQLEVATGTSQKGAKFSEHTWTPVKQTAEEIAAQRKKLENTAAAV